ncbi:MAG: hypothetical protein N2Z20_03195 [Elusimicrobiales bacterium]|nr:hypothetical protein [Elusimicrobiales bacterium]
MNSLVFLFLFNIGFLLANQFENFFETRQYIILLRYSSTYSSYKLNIERLIEDKKKYNYLIDIAKIKKLNSETSSFLDNIYNVYSDSITISQIYQVKFEIETLNRLLDDMQNFYKKNKKHEYNSMILLEKMLYRLEIYLRGLSNRISDL